MRSPESWSTSPGARILRALNATIGLGRPFGVEVRIYIIALVLIPLVLLADQVKAGLPFTEALVGALLIGVAMYVTIWFHEMGHIVAGWRYHIRTPLITLSPLGGLAHLSAPAPTPRADIVVSLAGPATHLVGLAVWWLLGLAVPDDFLRPDGWFFSPVAYLCEVMFHLNLWLMVFNLLPFYPMDGGRVLMAVLSLKNHPTYAMRRAGQVGVAGGLLFCALGALELFGILGMSYGSWFGWILFFIGLNNFLMSRRLIAAARMSHGPYGAPREAWEGDPEAWKGAAPGFSGNRGGAAPSKRAERKAERAAAEARKDEAELDALLQRVSDVGLTGLASKERARLKALSERGRMR